MLRLAFGIARKHEEWDDLPVWYKVAVIAMAWLGQSGGGGTKRSPLVTHASWVLEMRRLCEVHHNFEKLPHHMIQSLCSMMESYGHVRAAKVQPRLGTRPGSEKSWLVSCDLWPKVFAGLGNDSFCKDIIEAYTAGANAGGTADGGAGNQRGAGVLTNIQHTAGF